MFLHWAFASSSVPVLGMGRHAHKARSDLEALRAQGSGCGSQDVPVRWAYVGGVLKPETGWVGATAQM